jgi:hypothetical protein
MTESGHVPITKKNLAPIRRLAVETHRVSGQVGHQRVTAKNVQYMYPARDDRTVI